MAKQIQLTNVIESDVRQFYYDYSAKRAYPSLNDGMHIVNRCLLYALMNDFKGDTTDATVLSSKVLGKYHLHSDESIHRSALMMSGERLPLISATKDGKSYSTREGLMQPRYVRYSSTYWGKLVYKSLINANLIKNYDLSDYVPDYFPTMLPYLLFNNYTNINIGVTNKTMSFNPNEIFDMMLLLLRDINTPINELLKVFKGPDIGDTYTIVCQPQALYTMIKYGYGKFDVLVNVEFTPNTILFKDVPYRSTKYKFIRYLKTLQFNSMTVSQPQKIASPHHIAQMHYTLNSGYTLQDAQAELYNKTFLKKTIACELVGFHERDKKKGYSGKLDIIGIRDYLLKCLHFGYIERESELKKKIDELQNEVVKNSLLEKITRPEILPWFKEINDMPLAERERIFYERGNAEIKDLKIGKYVTVKGGISKEEVRIAYTREGNNILGKLDLRDDVVRELKKLNSELEELHKLLEPENIISYLHDTINDWKKQPECARKSPVFYKPINPNFASKSELSEEYIKHHMLTNTDKTDMKVNIVFYKDGTANYWNPEISSDIPAEFMNKPIYTILKCTTRDKLLIFNSRLRLKRGVDKFIAYLHEYNMLASDPETEFNGVIVYEWEGADISNDVYALIVTSKNRIKKMLLSWLIQKFEAVNPFPMYHDEYIIDIKYGTREELNKYTVEVLTELGIKRKELATTSEKSVKGYVTLVSYSFNRDTIDYKLCNNEDFVRVLEDKTLKEVSVSPEYVTKRDIYKEFTIEQAGKYNHYISSDKEYYDYQGKLVNIQQVFSIDTTNNLENVLAKLPDNYLSIRTQTSKLRREKENSGQ